MAYTTSHIEDERQGSPNSVTHKASGALEVSLTIASVERNICLRLVKILLSALLSAAG